MTPRAVEHVRTQVANQWRTEWRLQCDQCGAMARRHWRDLSDPQIAEKNFKTQGWVIGKAVTCPACSAQKHKTPAPPGAERKRTDRMTTERKTSQKPRDLTVEERGRVRDALDVYFDAEKGFYTDGYSDQQVGRELDLPWASVAAFRDLAYGPIRSDPILEEVRAGLVAVEKTLAGLKAKAATLEQRLS
ncbi:hypothetical protein F1188_20185 [Roseospira marina]|uniref:Uncharacterized protein n=1 Tax=Roseospira marina TaxID=140057 RepID=A0A5M6I460_9PROT|nr:hypothetical protein [Roseospira marina]KAA5603006.1 hypothetical protein F1188_20185 [Roseospira marina]MBB4313031.1 hypothetical protein [Roseospira marina]MBB5089294.1 hypothetical protein [Roseospira marina]